MTHWTDITPADAVEFTLPQDGVEGPRTTSGEECPWPWEPQQFDSAPIGMYHCGYCGEMVVAGVPHPDYAVEINP